MAEIGPRERELQTEEDEREKERIAYPKEIEETER